MKKKGAERRNSRKSSVRKSSAKKFPWKATTTKSYELDLKKKKQLFINLLHNNNFCSCKADKKKITKKITGEKKYKMPVKP